MNRSHQWVFTFGDSQCHIHSRLREGHISGHSPLMIVERGEVGTEVFNEEVPEKVTSVGSHLW